MDYLEMIDNNEADKPESQQRWILVCNKNISKWTIFTPISFPAFSPRPFQNMELSGVPALHFAWWLAARLIPGEKYGHSVKYH